MILGITMIMVMVIIMVNRIKMKLRAKKRLKTVFEREMMTMETTIARR